MVNQNVVVTGGTDQAIDRLRELLVSGRKGVIGFRFVATHSHLASLGFMVSIPTAN